MSGEAEYYIPENIEDETLRYVADMVKEVLKENDILEKIIQKHITAYSKTLNENSSSKSLQVMNQNRKLFFSTITPSGVIKSPSPRCSSVGAKRDAKATCIVSPRLRTPVKANRIGPCKERKRLSFDVEGNEHLKSPVKAFAEDFDGGQLSINTTSSFFGNADVAKPHDKAEGIPEWFYTPVIQDQIAENALTGTLHIDKTITSLLNKDKTSINYNKDQERKAWYLQSRPSIFSFEKVPKVFDSPDRFVETRVNIEGKPETLTSQDIYDLDDEYLKRETQDDQAIAASPENQNSTPENYEIENRTSTRCLPFRPPFNRSEEKVSVSDKHNTNKEDSANHDEKLESISSLSADQLQTSSISYKTPEKLQTVTVKADKEDRTPKKQIVAEKVIATNGKECSSPVEDVKTSNNQNMKKRKSVEELEEAMVITSLITEDQELKVPSKVSKLKHELTINDGKDVSTDISVKNGNDSFCSDIDSPMDVNNPLYCIDNATIDNDGYDKTSKLNTEFLTNKEATSLVTEYQELKVHSKMSRLNHELLTRDEEVAISANVSIMSGNDSFCSTNDSPMDVNNPLHSVDNSDMDDSGCDKITKLNAQLWTNDGKDILAVSDISANDSFCSTTDSPMDVNNPLHSVDNSDMDDNGCDKITKLNTELWTNVRRDIISATVSDMSGNDSFCSTNDSPMDVNNPLHSVDNSDMDDDGCDKTTKLNTEIWTIGEKYISDDISVKNGNDSICSINNSPMDANNPFLSADNYATDGNDSENRPHGAFTVNPEIAESDDKSVKPVVHINTYNMSVIPDKKSERSTYQAPIKHNGLLLLSNKATNDIKFPSTVKDTKSPHSPKMEKQKSDDYSEEATMANSLITEDQKSMKLSKMSELNNLTANDEKFTISADHLVINGNTCSTDEPPMSPMDVNNPFHSAIDCNDSFDHPDSDFIINQDIGKTHNGSVMPGVYSIENDEIILVTPVKKSEGSTYQMSETQNCVSNFLPQAIQKEMVTEVKSDNRIPKCDRSKTDAHKTVESLTNLMQNLSPSERHSSDYTSPKSMIRVSVVDNATSIEKRSAGNTFKKPITPQSIGDNATPVKKRSSDDTFKKPMTRRSIGDNATSTEKCSSDDIFKKPMTSGSIGGNATPVKKRSSDDTFKKPMTRRSIGDNANSIEKRSSDGSFSKPKTPGSIWDNSASTEKLPLQYNVSKTVTPPRECIISSELSIQAAKFLEYLKQREARFSMYLHLFIEDQQDLSVICVHIERLAYVLDIQLSDNQSDSISVLNFQDKARKTFLKGSSWLIHTAGDVKTCEDCIRKVDEIQEKVKQFCRETKLDRTPKDFKDLEASFRRVNKIADDMILVREVKRPSIIQFGYEVESLHQAFIKCMLEVGLLKQSSKISSD